MSFRVTQAALARAALSNIQRAQGNIASSQEQLATGRRINRLSDAPLDAAQAQRLHSYSSKVQQYQRNLERAQSQIEYAAATTQELSDVFIQAREICLRGADSATGPDERRSLAVAVDQLLDTLMRRANASFNGRYIFAGTADDAPPFTAELDETGNLGAIAYSGDSGRIELQVGPHARLQTNEPGSTVFVDPATGETSFDALIELRDLLRNPDGRSETETCQALSAHVGQVAEAHERIVDAASRFGWRSSQLEFTRTTLDNMMLSDTELLSSLEDADFATAALQLSTQEAALEAALAVSARILTTSLLEYLR